MKRRTFAQALAALAGTSLLAQPVAVTLAQSGATPMASPVADANTVHVLHAGSLTRLIQQGLAPAAAAEGLTVTDTRGGSVDVANSIKDGSLVGDVFMSAGADVNQVLMGEENGNWVSWFLVFASNEVVIAYSPKSKLTDQFEQASKGEIPWYQVLEQPGVTFGRNDPNLDPLGYYAVFISQLIDTYYKMPGLGERIFGDANNPAQVISPDVEMLESGELDAMFAYRTGAEDAGVPYITLPAEINLSDPTLDDVYAKASYTTDTGQVFRGATIRYTVAPIRGGNMSTSEQFIEFLISDEGKKLTEAAYFLPHPIWVGGDAGAVPAGIKERIEGTYPTP